MGQVTWDISGKILLAPMLADVRTAFGTEVPIEGVRVLVEAKEFGLDPTWDNWGEVITGSDGGFRLRKEKDESRRRFRIRVLFKSDQLKIYPDDSILDNLLFQLLDPLVPAGLVAELFDATLLEQLIEQTTRVAYDVKWVTVHENPDGDKFEPATVRIPDCVFEPGGRMDLGGADHRRRAEIWYLAHKYINFINGLDGVGFSADRPLAIKYPHNNMIIPDGVEASYLNPHNDVMYLVRNSSDDDFNAQTIAHELMHFWEYQNTVGEEGLAWQILFHNPHGRARDNFIENAWVGWYEAFAEVTSNEMYRRLFKVRGDYYGADMDGDGSPDPAERRPIARPMLRNNGVTTLPLVDHFELGWLSALSLLLCQDVQSLDMNSTSTVYAADPTPGSRPSITSYDVPVMGLLDLLTVVASANGGMGRDAMTLVGFYNRVASVLAEFTEDHKNAYLALLDPAGTVQPTDVLPRLEAVLRDPRTIGTLNTTATP